MSSQDKSIKEFWTWFAKNSSKLSSEIISQNSIGELEERLHNVEILDWEIGPGLSKSNLLVISPRGDRSLLNLTRAFVAQAPEILDWEFYPAKLTRSWNLTFDVVVDGEAIEIDGKEWEFVTYKFKDGSHDLLFKPVCHEGFDRDQIYWAALTITDGELGEEKRIDLVGNIEIVDSWDAKETQSARKIAPGVLNRAITYGYTP